MASQPITYYVRAIISHSLRCLIRSITAIWAGHRDAPLSVHGLVQAERLGKHFSEVPIDSIFTSDLKRAATTAHSVHTQSTNPPPIVVSRYLREQFFGSAEGHPWNEGPYDSSVRANMGWEDSRQFRLAADGESLDDVAVRADAALRHFVAPHLIHAAKSEGDHHIMIFAHGLFLSELMFALRRSSEPKLHFVKNTTYTNTGWSRVELNLLSPIPQVDDTPLAKDLTHPLVANNHAISALGILPPPLRSTESTPTMSVKVLAFNQVEHLEGLVRQRGGVGNSAHDPAQTKIEKFFTPLS